MDNKEYKGAKFLIEIKHCDHASWQGVVTWIDQQKKECFRSALELIKLLDSAVSEEESK